MGVNPKLSFVDWLISIGCLILITICAFNIGFYVAEDSIQPAGTSGVESRFHVWSLTTGSHLFVGTLRGTCQAGKENGLLFYRIAQSSLGKIGDSSQRICVLQRNIALVDINSGNEKFEQVIKP